MKKTLVASALLLTAFAGQAYEIDNMSWEQIEAQAQEEGQVTFAVWYLQPAWREFVQSFEKETGIKVRIPEGSHDGNRNKLQAESRRNQGTMDVVALGAMAIPALDYKKVLMPLDKLPEFDKLSTRSEGVETDGYGVTFWGNQTGIAYDPARIDEQDLPQSFAELEAFIKDSPKLFGVNDPNGGGAGGRFIQAATVQVSGQFDMTEEVDRSVVKSWSKTWDWFQDNKENMVITASNADSLTRINDGEIAIAPAWEDHLAGLQKGGAITDRIKFYIPEFGMSGGGNFVTIPANTKNKAASLVFVNWLMSADTQSKLNEVFGVAPQHPDADASAALIPQEMRQFASEPFSSAYSTENSRQFTRNVMMR